MMNYSDTHTHLDFDNFDQDRPKVITRAKEAGLVFVINIGIDLQTSQRSIELTREFPGFIYAAVGVHPNYSSAFDLETLKRVETLAAQPGVVSIGEIGLDYYRDYATPAQQKVALFAQLELAQRLQLPVIIHERASAHELALILSQWQAELPLESAIKHRPGVMHAYGGGLEYVPMLLEAGFYFGIGGPVTYKNAEEKRDLVRMLPMERMLLETDCPFMPPQAQRGKRNEPGFIPMIAAKIADLRGVTAEEVGEQLTGNARRLFYLADCFICDGLL